MCVKDLNLQKLERKQLTIKAIKELKKFKVSK